ncbi:MAG TPA: thioredoxin family protein [Leeuwenhoekiella sp.]|nr:thioredoxin family protein [Leeuwenhoekiella sp.]
MKKLAILATLAVLAIISAFAVTTIDFWKTGYEVGDTATDFSLKNVNDKMVSMADYEKAKGFIIAFTCNTCPFSRANEDRLIALDQKYKDQGYPVIAINPNDASTNERESFTAMKKRSREKGFTFPYLYEGNKKVHKTYGAIKTPHVYLLSKESDELIVKYIGAIDDSSRDARNVDQKFLENAVDALLAGKPIQVTSTKAIGCSVKN